MRIRCESENVIFSTLTSEFKQGDLFEEELLSSLGWKGLQMFLKRLGMAKVILREMCVIVQKVIRNVENL